MPGESAGNEQGAAENEQGAAVETEVVHSSIADMLSGDSDKDALGNANVDIEGSIPEADLEPDKKGEKDELEPPAKKEAAVPPEDWEAQLAAFKAKALDETTKRQNLEDSINRGPKKSVEKADLFENPDERLAQELNPVVDSMTNKMLCLAESNARRHYGTEKFSAAQDAFLAAAATNPGMVQAALNSPDPGEYQFVEGEKLILSKELGDGGIDEMRTKIRAEERASLQDEIKKGVEDKLKEIGKLPPSSADFNGKNTRQEPVKTDASLTDILGR